MNVIKAEISKEKGSKKRIYSFEANNETFKAYYLPTRAPTLEIMHNGSLLGKTDRPNTKLEYTVNSKTGPLKITAWIDYRFSLTIGYTRGAGIEVDGKPVQYTVTDPETHIKKGRSALYVLLAILFIQSVYNFFTSLETYTSDEWASMTAAQSYFAAGIISALYFIPFLFILLAAIKYKAWTTFAILSGIIIAALEMIAYIILSINSFSYGIAAALLIRIGVLFTLFNAFKFKRRQKKANLL